MATIPETLTRALQYHQAGQLAQAEQLYRQILEIDPNEPDALHLLGVAASQQGKQQEAIHFIERAIVLDGRQAPFHHNLGEAYRRAGRLAEAIASYRRAVQLLPRYPAAYSSLATCLREQGQLEEAEACCQEALRLQPNSATALNTLGMLRAAGGRLDEALSCFRAVVALRPAFAEAHYNLGTALQACDRLEEAVACHREALRLQPVYHEALSNLGSVLVDLGRVEEGLACYNENLRLRPDNAEVHLNRGIAWLLAGNFEEGWAEYEWRRQVKDEHVKAVPGPLWDGSLLEGRTILLYHEQGVGDILQFIRYAALVKQRGGRVLFACPPELERVLRGCQGIDELLLLYPGSVFPAYDVQAPLLSLPFLFQTTLATVPAPIPYLVADPACVERWRPALAAIRGFKIGMVWQGNPRLRKDRQRSVRLAQLAPLARLPGVQLIGLQYGPVHEQLAGVSAWNALDLGSRLETWVDTAAVLSQLDLVVTVDTAVAHLAGALGVPVWVALPFVPDWRWLLGREDSPWYPTMRLFRQVERGSWEGVFERMSTAAAPLISPSATVETLIARKGLADPPELRANPEVGSAVNGATLAGAREDDPPSNCLSDL
jgi:tetratricopeptide (TPR) repeat protein